MKAYRLLRSNKETGPYSSTELIALGLKAYDLIWVEGKSAAWRYPGELEEFKIHAPLEEQPDDHFYPQKIPAGIISYKVANTNPIQKEIKPREKIIQYNATLVSPEIKGVMIEIRNTRPELEKGLFEVREKVPPITNIPYEEEKESLEKPRIKIKADTKKIDTNTPWATSFVNQVQNRKQIPDGSLNWQNAWHDWEQHRKGTSSSLNFNFNKIAPSSYVEPVMETKFSQSLDDIKEKYIETVLKNKQSKPLLFFSGPAKYLFPGTAIIIVLGLGFWIGTMGGKPLEPLASSEIPAGAVKTGDMVAQQPENIQSENIDSNGDKTTLVYTLPEIKKHKINNTQVEKKQPVNFKYASSGRKNTDADFDETTSSATNESLFVQPATENENTTVSKKEDTKPVFPITKTQTVKDFVTLGNPIISLGENSSDNTLQVHNISDIAFNLVVIDLQYYDANGRFHKGETLYLKNFTGGKSINVKIPEDKTSVKVAAAVSMISSDEKSIYLIAE